MLIEQRLANEGPDAGVAYVLWFFLGWISGHRFYLGRWGTALFQIALNCILVGFVWVVIDLFLIPPMVRENRSRLRTLLVAQASGALPAIEG